MDTRFQLVDVDEVAEILGMTRPRVRQMLLTSKFMDVGEAAEMLGMTRPGVRQLLLAGKLEGWKLNKRAWIIPFVEVQRYRKMKYTTGRKRKNDPRFK